MSGMKKTMLLAVLPMLLAGATAHGAVVLTDILSTQSGPGGPFDSFGFAAVNANGDLAFSASNDGSSTTTGSVLARFSGGVVTQLAFSPSSSTTNINDIRVFESVDINDAGTVVGRALFGGASTSVRPRGILAFDPSNVQTTLFLDAEGTNAPNGPLSTSFGNPSINNAGNVLQSVEFDNSALGRELRVLPATGGASSVIVETLTTTTIEGWTFAAVGGLGLLRDNGDAILYANYDRSGGQTTTAGQDAIFYYIAATGQVRTLLDDNSDVGHTGPYPQYSGVGNVNAAGKLTTVANDSTTGEAWVLVYDLNTNTVAEYVDDTGPYDNFFSRPRILDNGLVLFGG